MMRLDELASVTATGGLISIAGEIDCWSAPALQQMIKAAEITSPRFDLSQVTFIDSTGLHLLINLRNELGPLPVVAESRAVARLLELTGTRSFLIEPSVGESDGTSSVDTDVNCDEQWRRVMEAFEDLTNAYYGEGRAPADAHITDVVMEFVRQCHEMKQCAISASAESSAFSPTALYELLSNTRVLDICDALLHAEGLVAEGSPKVTARIQRTYTEPNGRAFAIIEHGREGERPRTTDAMVIAENCVNAWTRFIRKQRIAGGNYGA